MTIIISIIFTFIFGFFMGKKYEVDFPSDPLRKKLEKEMFDKKMKLINSIGLHRRTDKDTLSLAWQDLNKTFYRDLN